MNASKAIEHGAAAVALFDGDGELQHRLTFDFAGPGNDTGDDTVFEAAWIAQGDD